MEFYNFSNYVILLVLWLVSFQFCCKTSLLVQAEAICTSSSGSCSNAPGSCSPDSVKKCIGDTGFPTSRPRSPSVEECREDRFGYSHCREEGLDEIAQLESVVADVVSNNPRYFTVNVSWSNNTPAILYEVRLKGQHGDVRRCVCINDPNVLKFNFVGHEYAGSPDNTLTVEVIPYPSDSNSKIRSFETAPFQRPLGCADAIVDNTVCNTKIYGPSENLTVISSLCDDNTKKLNIDWFPPSIPSGAPPPQTYYLQIHTSDGNRLHNFKVMNTTSVVVGNLNASINYEARLQSYRECSGVGNHFIRDGGGVEFLGCGRTASKDEQLTGVCHPTVSTTIATMTITAGIDSTTPTSTNGTVTGGIRHSAEHLSLLSIPVLILVSGIAAFSIVCIILVYKYCHSDDDADLHPDCLQPEFKVFVFYCSSTPQGDVEYIQEHVVCALSQYFEVCSPNDFARGNISTWLEETVKTSTKVLLVCNQELYQEWGKGQDRDPAVNSLQHLIAAAVSSNDIDRFAVVLTRKGKKETCIPEDSYIKLMRIFSVEKGSELDPVYRFVTSSQTFQFSSTTSTPTSEGPAHVAILVE